MIVRYYRNQSRVKGLACDTPTMRAAVNLVISVKDGQLPDNQSLTLLADAFLEAFGGKNPKDILGGSLGLVPTPGGQSHYGFTPADIVSAYIELERRRLGNGRGALASAKRSAADVFVDIGGGNVARAIERDWKAGRSTVECLSDADLCELLRPYEY
jgi:hypothetical protein